MKKDKFSKDALNENVRNGTPAAPFRHENHARPITRRDMLAQGLLGSAAYVMMPSILSVIANNEAFAAAACTAASPGARMTPFLIFDLVGGGNIAGSNVMVGKRGGQSDFIASYSTLGLPDAMHPKLAGQTNNEMGLVFHSDSAILRGIQSTTTSGTRANIDGAVFCTASVDDTANNPHNPIYWINKAGAQGRLVSLVGNKSSQSGGNSLAPPSSIVAASQPVTIRSSNDARSIVSPGKIATLLSPKDVERVMRATQAMSEAKLAKFQALAVSDQVKTLIDCGYIQGTEMVLKFTPDAVDPTKDGICTAVFNNIAGNATVNQVATIAKLLVDGNAGGGTVQLGGFDYHSGNRADGEEADQALGALIGQCMEYAARKGQDLMIYVFTDGGVASNGNVDATTGGRGKLSWQGDNSQGSSSFTLVYKKDGKPGIRNGRRQIGAFNDTGGVDSQAAKTSTSVETLAKAVVANYLALHGQEGTFAKVIGDDPFGSELDNHLAFTKLR